MSLPDTPVKDISSPPTCIKPVPDVGRPEVLANVILVPEPPVPLASSSKAPFKVVVNSPRTSPPQVPKFQPKAGNCCAGPTG